MKFRFTTSGKPAQGRGQVLVLFILLSGLIFISAMIAVDLGTYVWARQKLEVAVDAAALAGGLELPESGTAARTKALQYIALNDPGVDPNDVVTWCWAGLGPRTLILSTLS